MAGTKTRKMTIEFGNVAEFLAAIGISYAIILAGKYIVLRMFLKWLFSDEYAQGLREKSLKTFTEKLEELKAKKEQSQQTGK